MDGEYTVQLTKRGNKIPEPEESSEAPVPEEISTPKISGGKHYEKTSKGVRPIAVHVTDHAVYALQLSNKNELVLYGKTELSEKIVEGGVILDSEKLTQSIQSLLLDIIPDFDEKKAVPCSTCISKSQTYIQHFVVPHADGAVTYDSVYEKLSNILPFSITHASVEYTSWKKGDEEHVVAAVIPKGVVASFVEVLQLSSLSVVLVDVEASALGRALIPSDEVESSLIVDIGARSTSLNSYTGEKLTSSLFAPVGSDTLSAVYDSTPSENGNNKAGGTEEDVVATLIQSIELLLLGHQSLSANKEIGTIYLVGRTHFLPLLAEYIEETVRIKTHVGNPLQHLTSHSPGIEKDAVLYSTTIGLALRTDVSKGYNLLSKHKKKSNPVTHTFTMVIFFKKHLRESLLFLLVLVCFFGLLMWM